MWCIAITTTYDPGKLEKADFVVSAYKEIDLEAVNKYASIK